MSEGYVWMARPRNYLRERRDFALDRHSTAKHPLIIAPKPVASSETSVGVPNGPLLRSTSSAPKTTSSTSSSPRVSVPAGFIDPLSQMALGDDLGAFRGESNKKAEDRERLLGPWAAKKENILSKFATTEKLTLTSSYLSDNDRVVTVTKSSAVADKIQSRLEQLDNFEAGSMKEMMNLSQQEYISKIDQLHNKLQQAWREDQRVTALKISIQLAKLLSDTYPLQFYPSKFVLLTDVLETFGQLIYDRILDKSGTVFGDSSPDRTPEAAKETCRNWFFKVASIRELLPRLYVEISIMRCSSFLEDKTTYLEIIPRFAKMIRGIGDHLVASYMRCYLARMILQVAPESVPHFFILIEDFVITTQQLHREKMLESRLSEQKLNMSSYLLLHQPALEWITECYAKQTGARGMEQLLALAEGSRYSGLLLNCVMTSFKADLVAKKPMFICALIRNSSDEVFPTHILCRTLGLCLLGADTDPKERKKIMNEIWSMIVEQKDSQSYISAAEIWVEFAAKFFTVKEVNRILSDIISRLLPDRAYESCANTLLQITEKIVRHTRSFTLLLSMDKFMPFLDLLQKEDIRMSAAKLLLDSYLKFERDSTSDPVVLNGAMFACKVIHDGISSLSSDDEKRAAAALICGFIRRVDFGKDFERQLSFYGECREAFHNLDDVAEFLVHCVNHLAMSTRAIQKGQHNRRTAAFVRACVAFSFITVPSLYHIPSQLHLYLECAQVALANQCVGQVEALIKAAIQLFNSSKDELESFATKMHPVHRIVIEFASDLLGLLLIVPDPPEQGMLYLVRGLMNSIQGFDLEVRMALQLQLLVYCSAAEQEDYIYHVDGVDSNDRLYGGDPDFVTEIQEMGGVCLSHLISIVNELKCAKQAGQAAKLALDVIDVLMSHGDVGRVKGALKVMIGVVKSAGQQLPASDGKRWQSLRSVIRSRPWASDIGDLL
ncbi:LOW QUALITY PROTEIN: VPS35 endosomal protein-sorting factor-like [Paramacrobiotus metropolitanus]|uniref:LOW QUALITY PROTEIN: VPS35 endosomal protein-sorting factor-like n=1 Tax=Paramacrobiotus metropolitanus TaxID=2943436 RepID=UPI0024464AB9|nr:LOW QUALITY PROTEIN: VPS35 endosomal protein-sorting factor-like [Paramacrobiotus metropolitanus]